MGPTITSTILTRQAPLIASGGIGTSLVKYSARMPTSDDGWISNPDLRGNPSVIVFFDGLVSRMQKRVATHQLVGSRIWG
jgi:hypothetical protein